MFGRPNFNTGPFTGTGRTVVADIITIKLAVGGAVIRTNAAHTIRTTRIDTVATNKA